MKREFPLLLTVASLLRCYDAEQVTSFDGNNANGQARGYALLIGQSLHVINIDQLEKSVAQGPH